MENRKKKGKKKANATKPNQAADDSSDLTTPNQQQGNREKKKRKKKSQHGERLPAFAAGVQGMYLSNFPASTRGAEMFKVWWWQGDERVNELNERTNGSWIDGMNDWKGNVTPVLTVWCVVKPMKGVPTLLQFDCLRYKYPVGTSLPHTYLYALSSANINSNNLRLLPRPLFPPLLPLLLCLLLFIRKKDPGQAPTGPDARGMS